MLFQDLSFKRARALSENSSNDQTRYRVLCSSLVERQSAGTEGSIYHGNSDFFSAPRL